MSSRHDDPQFKIRIPAHLKARLEEDARANGRTITGEILQRIELGASNDARLADFLQEEVADLEYLLEGAKTEAERLSKELKEQKDHIIDNGPVDGLLLGQLIVSHSWALERVADYERRLRRIKRVLGE